MRRYLLTLILIAFMAGAGLSATADTASACPMCKTAAEKAKNHPTNRNPQAYYYSILFMLAVPTALFSTIGYTLFKLNSVESEGLVGDDIPEDLPDLSDLDEE